MQTLCDPHWTLAYKSCKGQRGIRHCCSRHHEGHLAAGPLWPGGGEGHPQQAVAAGGTRQSTLFVMVVARPQEKGGERVRGL